MTKEENCEGAAATAVDGFGRLDVLVNNAGRGMKSQQTLDDRADALLGRAAGDLAYGDRHQCDGSVPDSARRSVPPLLWLASPRSDDVTGCRFILTSWRRAEAVAQAGWWTRCRKDVSIIAERCFRSDGYSRSGKGP